MMMNSVYQKLWYKMDTSQSTDSLNSAKTVKRKFMQWAWKWFYTNSLTSEELIDKPDVTTIICLLKSIGFQLHEFGKCENSDEKDTKTCKNNVTVIVECGASKMKAVLELDEVKCQCPNDRETIDASFWSVSGTGSVDNVNKLMETGSNLLPKVDKEAERMIHDIIYRLLNTINPKLSAGQSLESTLSTNEDFNLSFHDIVQSRTKSNESPLTRCYTQPEIICRRRIGQAQETCESFSKQHSSTDRRLSISIQNISKNETEIKKVQGEKTPVLLREKTWDKTYHEPRSLPPKISSPLNVSQLCASTSELSLHNDDFGGSSLTDCLLMVKFYAEKALTLNEKNLNDDDVFLKPSTPLWGNSPRKSKSPIRPPGSRCISPSLSTKSLPQKPIIRRSVGGLSTITKTQISPATKLSVLPKLPPRGKSLGGATPVIKQAVDSAQKKIAASKLTTLKSSSRCLSSSSTSLNTTSISTTPSALNNDPKTSMIKKRYSTTGSTTPTMLKSSTLPRKKITSNSSADFLQTSSALKTFKTRTTASNIPAKKDTNTSASLTSTEKFSYSSKK